MSGSFFRLLLILVLNAVTAALLREVFGELGRRLWADAVVRIWGLEVNVPYLCAWIAAGMFAAPLELGVAEYLLARIRRRRPSLGAVFLWYADGAKLSVAARYGAWGMVLSAAQLFLLDLPLNVVSQGLNAVLADLTEQINAGAASPAPDYSLMDTGRTWLWIAMAAAFLLLRLLTAAVPYLTADSGSVLGSVAASVKLVGRHLGAYLLFLLSFAGWLLIAWITFGLALLYLIPYAALANAAFLEQLRGPLVPPPGGGRADVPDEPEDPDGPPEAYL